MCRQFDSGPRHRTLLLGFLDRAVLASSFAELVHFVEKGVTENANHLLTRPTEHPVEGSLDSA